MEHQVARTATGTGAGAIGGDVRAQQARKQVGALGGEIELDEGGGREGGQVVSRAAAGKDARRRRERSSTSRGSYGWLRATRSWFSFEAASTPMDGEPLVGHGGGPKGG